MQAIFYHKYWHLMCTAINHMVRSAFSSGTLPPGINKTLITFIPKIPHPENMSQFRPISLCDVSMKIISKILVSKLRPFLSSIVAPAQSSFIPGRLTSDNILITQEAIYTMKKKEGRSGLMVIKVDLAKAYDQISWDFLRSVLVEIGLPHI
ncbi:hypothetical protein L1049_027472 [Liquidambar formosana]|uniref:Reverse transcriptase domain-containing protein n=1 Tax=Liquidambar formosana TaxID=63359 RepID=A0AAP0WVF9_LIQFO